jgi:NAD(P)-dependent dehydrogenase (short-subunit alcohol dehydrogenase family)
LSPEAVALPVTVDTPLVHAHAGCRDPRRAAAASPGEIAGAAVFLLDGSKKSSMTGHFLNADGG